jgi:hypothetical protein
MEPKPMNPQSFPLVQARQAKLLEACGFKCEAVGEREFNGRMVPMYRPTGEWRQPVASLLGYGGAAFGGKSYGMLVLAYLLMVIFPGVQIAYFRRTYSQLDGPGAAIQKSYGIFGGVAVDRDGGKEWSHPNGSKFFFRHCQHESDVYDYQSQQIDVLLVDEATHFSWFIIDYLLTRNRASGEVRVVGFKPFALLCSNPGNIGHAYYSQVFDMENKHGPHETVKEVLNPNGKRVKVFFLPALLEDNAIGVAADPEYEDRLLQRNAEIARALRWGDWSIFAGQAFPTWTRDRIAIPKKEQFEIPTHWAKWRAMDYGFIHPMVMGWFTINPQTKRVYVYRAVSASNLSDEQQAELMDKMSPPEERYAATYASPDMWASTAKKSGKIQTSVDEFKAKGIILTRADNDRVNGVRKIDRLLFDGPDGLPMIQVFEPYYEVFKCMETLVREDAQQGKNPEDVKKVDGDDPFDMLKYGLTNMKQPERKDGTAKTAHPAKGMSSI